MANHANRGLMIAISTVWFSAAAWGQGFDVGKFEYLNWCASCHGNDGKGNGPVSKVLKVAPANLTVLAKNNNGVFPLDSVFETIYGLKEMIAHGTRDMPVWGYRFAPFQNSALSPRASEFFTGFPYEPDSVVRTCILAMIDYLNRIQEK
jgi:hypothetical protein